MSVDMAKPDDGPAIASPRSSQRGGTALVLGGAFTAILVFLAVFAPLLGTIDPGAVDPAVRNAAPGALVARTLPDGTALEHVALLGTDTLGRDLYSRVVYGARVSLFIGLLVGAASCLVGLAIGLVAGYVRWVDAVVMRLVDAVMAIPGILLALALVSVWGPGLVTVALAIFVPEVPRVVRLVRSVVAKIAAEPYIEAAIASGSGTARILITHILPSTWGPLVVQGTFVCISAILLEAALSFLGIGVPADVPSWGNIIADGRQWFRLTPHVILVPSAFIVITAIGVNLLGTGLRLRLAAPMPEGRA